MNSVWGWLHTNRSVLYSFHFFDRNSWQIALSNCVFVLDIFVANVYTAKHNKSDSKYFHTFASESNDKQRGTLANIDARSAFTSFAASQSLNSVFAYHAIRMGQQNKHTHTHTYTHINQPTQHINQNRFVHQTVAVTANSATKRTHNKLVNNIYIFLYITTSICLCVVPDQTLARRLSRKQQRFRRE
jgi:hypothetical protein